MLPIILLMVAWVCTLVFCFLLSSSSTTGSTHNTERYTDNIRQACPFKVKVPQSPSLPKTKSESSPEEVNTGTYELGDAIGTPPWRVSSFADPSAKWIWNDPNARSTANLGCVSFRKVYVGPSDASATFHVVVDNTCVVYLNGVKVFEVSTAYSWSAGVGYPRVNVQLVKGENDIIVLAKNIAVSPAGLLFSAIAQDGKTVLFNSDKHWVSCSTCPEEPSASPSTTLSPSSSSSPTSSWANGLTFSVYSGYYNMDPSFFRSSRANLLGTGKSSNSSSLGTFTSGATNFNGGNNFSVEWTGVFRPKVNGDHTFLFFKLDDAGSFWIGPNAESGYTADNANVHVAYYYNKQKWSSTVNMEKGKDYPIRIQFGQVTGTIDMEFGFMQPGDQYTLRTDGTGYYFS